MRKHGLDMDMMRFIHYLTYGILISFTRHSAITQIQLLSLDYIIAVYPLVLIVIIYTLVRLHYKNCRVVAWLWRPFIRCFARFRRQWDIQNSLVDAFATFLLLSYVKFLSVSLDILTPSYVWDVYGRQQHPVVYYHLLLLLFYYYTFSFC